MPSSGISLLFGCGGAGGSRTLVQTRKPYAFYMLIFAFGFRAQARPKPPTYALASKFHSDCEARPELFPILLHRRIERFGTRAFGRCLVSTTVAEIKLIYYTSIKQREHKNRCQIIVR